MSGRSRIRHRCSYPLCQNVYRYPAEAPHVNKKFFTFPKKLRIRRAWKRVCNLPPDDKCRRVFVCGDHFEPQDYLPSSRPRRLKPWAVPHVDTSVNYIDVDPLSMPDASLTPQSREQHSHCGIYTSSFLPSFTASSVNRDTAITKSHPVEYQGDILSLRSLTDVISLEHSYCTSVSPISSKSRKRNFSDASEMTSRPEFHLVYENTSLIAPSCISSDIDQPLPSTVDDLTGVNSPAAYVTVVNETDNDVSSDVRSVGKIDGSSSDKKKQEKKKNKKKKTKPNSRKRSFETEKVDQAKRNTSDEKTCHFKLIMSSGAADLVLGETFTQLCIETGFHVSIFKTHEFVPGTTERVYIVTGSISAILAMLEFIMKFGKKYRNPIRLTKILVPNSTAQIIMGNDGNNIEQIQQTSGAKVEVGEKVIKKLHERCISVIGEWKKNKEACRMILAKIAEDPCNETCTHNVTYLKLSGAVANSTGCPSPVESNTSGAGHRLEVSPRSKDVACQVDLTACKHNQDPFGEPSVTTSSKDVACQMPPIWPLRDQAAAVVSQPTSEAFSFHVDLTNAGGVQDLTGELKRVRRQLTKEGLARTEVMEVSNAFTVLAKYGVVDFKMPQV